MTHYPADVAPRLNAFQERGIRDVVDGGRTADVNASRLQKILLRMCRKLNLFGSLRKQV
jgi:hypothetical protein